MAFVTPLFASTFTPKQRSAVTRRRPSVTMSAGEIPDKLQTILDRKAIEVANLRAEMESTGADHPLSKILASKGSAKRNKKFYKALNVPTGTLTVIAEVKRKSPSKGKIGEIPDPGLLSRVYYEGGASAISVLTDLEGFGGTMKDLERVVEVQSKYRGNYPGPCPVLRKDFIIDEVQIAEAVKGGASAVLLIVAALGKERTGELLEATHELGLDALVEVHDERELEEALEIGAEIVGVNNRDLRTFETKLETSFELVDKMPEGVVKVAESGIKDAMDAWKLRDVGFNAILVGESLVRAWETNMGDSTSYTASFNVARGMIRAFRQKGSVQFGNASAAVFGEKGEAAKETYGEISI